MDSVDHDDAPAPAAPPHGAISTNEHDVPALHSSRLDEALSAFEEALGLIDKDEQPAFYGVLLHDIAQTYEVAERFDVAAELYRESVDHKRRAENLADISTTLVALAQCLMSSARLDEAFAVLGEADEALGLAAPGLETSDLMFRRHEIGLLYERMGNRGIAAGYSHALTAYERTLDVIDRETDPSTYASVLRGVGEVFGALGQLHESVSAYSESVALLRTTDERSSLASALLDLGRMSRRLAEADGQKFLDEDAAAHLAARRHGGDDASREHPVPQTH